LRLAQTIQDPALLLWPHLGLGLILLSLGELPSALAHMEQSIALYDPQRHRPDQSPIVGQDPKVNCLSYAAGTLWRLGYPDQARQRSEEALSLARELTHPFSLAFALYGDALLHQFLRDVPAVQERADTILILAREQSFPVFLAIGTIFRGWVLSGQEQAKEGIAQIHQGIAAKQSTGTELSRPPDLAQLAVAYGRAGREKEGLSVLAEALDRVGKTGERMYEAELYGLKGELLLAQASKNQTANGKNQKSGLPSNQHLAPNTHEAEACFHRAIEIARTQQAKSLELRAATSLARLWQQQSKEAEAHKLLSEVYTWFTEGFDTKDLQEAKALLEELR